MRLRPRRAGGLGRASARRVRGPLLTLAAAVVLDVAAAPRGRAGLAVPRAHSHRGVFGVYRRARSGAGERRDDGARRAPLSSPQPGLPLRYSAGDAASLVAVACSSLLAGLVVARLHERVRAAEVGRAGRAEAEALARRFAFLEQASLILSSSRGLRDRVPRSRAADRAHPRRLVHHPSRDRRRRRSRFVAGAHRDPSRDLVVRALAEYGERALPFAARAARAAGGSGRPRRCCASPPPTTRSSSSIAPSRRRRCSGCRSARASGSSAS